MYSGFSCCPQLDHFNCCPQLRQRAERPRRVRAEASVAVVCEETAFRKTLSLEYTFLERASSLRQNVCAPTEELRLQLRSRNPAKKIDEYRYRTMTRAAS